MSNKKMSILQLKGLAGEKYNEVKLVEETRSEALRKVLKSENNIMLDYEDDTEDIDDGGNNMAQSVKPKVMTNLSQDCVKEVEVDLLPIEALEIGIIRDSKGYLSDVVDKYLEKLNSTVVPLAMTTILPQVAELKRHTLFVLGTERFAMSDDVRQDVITAYKDTITEKLKSGMPFKESLCTKIIHENTTYTNLKLCEAEWTYLVSLFRNYNAKLIQVGNDLLLTVGA